MDDMRQEILARCAQASESEDDKYSKLYEEAVRRTFENYPENVDKAIMKLRKDNYIQFSNQDDLKNPQKFRDIICQIIQKSGLEDYQKADRAL